MANFRNEITLRVSFPYVTQGCTLGILNAEITVHADQIWLSGEKWKAYAPWGNYPILVTGKATRKANTTYKVKAFCSWDGMHESKEEYKVKVISYN